jgi:hypothetical protein
MTKVQASFHQLLNQAASGNPRAIQKVIELDEIFADRTLIAQAPTLIVNFLPTYDYRIHAWPPVRNEDAATSCVTPVNHLRID